MADGLGRFWVLLLVAGLGAGSVGTAAAAGSISEPAETFESDPLTCWWKADRTAVFVGEQFGVTLTCRVIEAGKISVVPNWTAIEPGSVQLAPFEVVSGVRHQPITSGIWQYFQYDYRVRLIADSFFGQDIDIPPLRVVYNVRMMQGEVAQQGRDQTYLLPALPMRLLSVVTGNARDIRDASRESFAEIERHDFRATVAMVAAAIFAAFAVILVGLFAVRSVTQRRARTPVAQRPLSLGIITWGCRKELAGLRAAPGGAERSVEQVSRALAALRVVAAITIGHPIAQTRVRASQESRDGQFLVLPHPLSRKPVAVSASVTPETLSQWLIANKNSPTPAPDWRADIATQLRDALVAVSSARYGRPETKGSAGDLHGMMDRAMRSLQRLQIDTLWRWRKPAAPVEPGSAAGETAWAR